MSRDYARHYARFHPDTPEHDANLRSLLLRWLEPHLPADRGISVLDVGCGRGYALDLLRALGFTNLAGIDSDPGQVAFACGRGLPVTHVSDTPASLRAGGDRHGLILLMDVLEHIHPAAQADFLEAVAGSLAPGGRLIVTVPNAGSPLASHWRHVDPTHHLLFTVPSLEHALVQAGLVCESIHSVEFVVRPRYLFWLPTSRARRWWCLVLGRLLWRLLYLGELGPEQGKEAPLGPNLLAVARRP